MGTPSLLVALDYPEPFADVKLERLMAAAAWLTSAGLLHEDHIALDVEAHVEAEFALHELGAPSLLVLVDYSSCWRRCGRTSSIGPLFAGTEGSSLSPPC
jgi:hypothetical protein